jgi:hypothetical protein
VFSIDGYLKKAIQKGQKRFDGYMGKCRGTVTDFIRLATFLKLTCKCNRSMEFEDLRVDELAYLFFDFIAFELEPFGDRFFIEAAVLN